MAWICNRIQKVSPSLIAHSTVSRLFAHPISLVNPFTHLPRQSVIMPPPPAIPGQPSTTLCLIYYEYDLNYEHDFHHHHHYYYWREIDYYSRTSVFQYNRCHLSWGKRTCGLWVLWPTQHSLMPPKFRSENKLRYWSSMYACANCWKKNFIIFLSPLFCKYSSF